MRSYVRRGVPLRRDIRGHTWTHVEKNGGKSRGALAKEESCDGSNITAMYVIRIVCYSVLLLAAVTGANSAKCSRLIDGVTAPHSSAEGKFHFYMTLYNRTEQVYAYMPNTKYSVILKCDNSDQAHRKFRRFLISAEAVNMNETADIGVFELEDDTMTKFAENCPNIIVEASRVDKDDISVSWRSPAEASVCVNIRATVMEAADTWYMDNPNLQITMCPDSKAEFDDQGPVLQKCCACDEAKYEVILEGQWSRNTHPKDFPRGLSIRFSDVIGASHTGKYKFWQTNETASIGLRQLAELGATRKLESELKGRSEEIRTIIKARGISYPNVTGKTFAVFRVDRKHHLMSLVSMIVPSPDWFVGVSDFELCLPNCSWVMNKQLNLYPYDAGTDSGITYLSPDSPTVPQEPIRRITSTYPDDPASPFYDASGLDMKPLAKMYLNRQRLYEKSCADPSTDTDPCKVTPWADWNACSVTCGRGTQLRQRFFHDETAANAKNCKTELTDRRPCYNPQRPYCHGHHGELLDTDKCALTEWSLWSSCSSTCGEGSRTRSRNFRIKKYRKQCKAEPNGPQLEQSIECENSPCEGEDADEVRGRLSDDLSQDYVTAEDEDREMIQEWLQKCPKHRYTEWSMWSPCSSSCGPGKKLRSRMLLDKTVDSDDKDDEACKVQQATCLAEIPSCDFSREDAEQEDFKGIQAGSQIMESTERKDCELSEWSEWSECKNCRGFTISTRLIVSPARGDGKSCPKKLFRKKKCNKRPECSLQRDGTRRRFHRDKNNETEGEVSVDCEVTPWSTWSRCSEVTCGEALQTRVRSIMVQPRGLWAKLCPVLAEFRKCPKTGNCP